MRNQSFSGLPFFESLLKSQMGHDLKPFELLNQESGTEGLSLSLMEGGLLHFLVRQHRGQKWIELGTLSGFSAACLASALPSDGHLWTIELNPERFEKAKERFAKSPLATRVTLLCGDGQVLLKSLESQAPFDGLFIDANKGAYWSSLQWAKKFLKPGGMIVADNIFLGGHLWDRPQDSKWTKTVVDQMQKFVREALNPEDFLGSVVPTQEGLLVAIKK